MWPSEIDPSGHSSFLALIYIREEWKGYQERIPSKKVEEAEVICSALQHFQCKAMAPQHMSKGFLSSLGGGEAVNSPACKFLFDMYHMQRNEGNIINNLNNTWDEIGYLQIGDNPGRNEPGTGEMNYKNIFRHIYKKGFKGILGMEHGNAEPGKEGELALIKAYREADDFK